MDRLTIGPQVANLPTGFLSMAAHGAAHYAQYDSN